MSARTQTDEGVAGSSPVVGLPVRADPAGRSANDARRLLRGPAYN